VDYGIASSDNRAPSYEKDPSDVIDLSTSWHHLGNDAILTSTWSSDGLTIDSNLFSGLVTTVFVSGGTAGAINSLTNTIVTAVGRTLQRTLYIAVNEL